MSVSIPKKAGAKPEPKDKPDVNLSLPILLKALQAFKNGNFSVRLPSEWSGIGGKIADTFNEIIEMNSLIDSSLDSLNESVGKEGKISQRANITGKGGWGKIIDSINLIISDLAWPIAEISRVMGSVAKGDLTQSMAVEIEGRPLQGEFAQLAHVINAMVEQLNGFSSEVTRVAKEVGTDGKLGGQAVVEGAAGTWKDLTDNVNGMASNLTSQVRNISDVTIAVANGDLSRKITVDVRGEFLQLKEGINTMVEQLRAFAGEVTRVAREVGTEGKLGGQAVVLGVGGVWKDLTDNVNGMASNLTSQVRNIAEVTTAVANGDLALKITVDAKGEILELKNTINTMVDQLNAFSGEVTRVAKEVGSDGILGGQAKVKGVGGTWKDLTDSVNGMASNLTNQVRNIANVTTAVANGDLSRKITVDAKGEILELKNTINTMVDQLNAFASEVTRVAKEVGSDGKLGGQAKVKGVGGTWKDLTDSVNGMAANLTSQVRNIAEVTTAVANGDLTKQISVDVQGEMLELKDTINTMVDRLNAFAGEVTRVAREVGSDGKLGGQAKVEGVGGTWKDLTDNVNGMAANLTSQVRNIAEVTTAVANGDLSRKITVDARGEILELKNTINTMVEQLNSFAGEVTRVAKEVGSDGKLGGQAKVKGVGGTWKDLTQSVNGMAANLTNQVRNIATVTTAVANGDLTKKITVDAMGEILELKNTINTMVDQLNSFAGEVTRVAREVGSDGKLGGQAKVEGVGGTWKDLTDNVNGMAANLTSQVRNIAEVTTAVANGDLALKITVDAKGEILELKNTINTMVDQLNSFAGEVTRVATEVGSDGILGGQAKVEGVGGTWKDLTDSVNGMAANLTSQVRNIATVTTAVANGDLALKITVDAKGEILELKNTINAMVDRLNAFAGEVTRVATEVGSDGILGGQAEVKGVAGTWKDLTNSVNGMASNLTSQVRNIAEVTTAVANGDLALKITVDAKGEILELKNTINTMVDQLNAFAGEVTRVAREVGSDGILGGQAIVKGVGGTWKDLTDSVNGMASNLTSQVRNIANVTTAVANGDLALKITVDAKGEILELKNTINTMVDQLNSFAGEVTRVAKEVGSEGILGGQAKVEGVSGTWKDLTDSVNGMASNLTSQVRNIAEVTTAVANGDLALKITVDARGEILELKNTINTMVDQLNSFAGEVTRVAKEVGSDGILGGQAIVKGVGGTWKDLTDSVNGMASNLTSQVRNIANVTTAVANGDLALKITVDAKGEILELKNTINTMVDQLNAFAGEVTRVATEVGSDGQLGGQAKVKGVSGTWKDLTDSVNGMASNLTSQVRNIATVTTAVANGDLTKKITVDAKGEILELKDTINTMVDQLNAFAGEVTRVAKEVGSDGKLGGQAEVKGVGGTWKDLTDNVNGMASNLTSQVRNIAEVTTAVANGDLALKITVDARGEILELKNTINAMVDRLNAFAGEVTRVATEVGSDGQLGGQALVKGVGGTWKDLTDSVNGMASNLTSQVRNIAEVTTAVANGDLSRKITVDARGEILELKDTINTMVDQLNSFAGEVTRVATEVGSDGQLGGQAKVKGVSGTWKDLTDSVNGMAANLTSQVRNIATVTTAVANGDLTKKITVDAMGEILELKNTINTMVDQLNSFAGEVTRVAKEVGSDGILGGQAEVKGVAGTWKDLTNNVNGMAANLTSQVRNIAEVTTAVANGDLALKITVDARGEILELKNTINAMVDRLNAFAGEVTRVATEVGSDGILGGQAEVKGVAGTWKDLTNSVNGMASNLTSQVRNIATVTTAVANGDLSRKITVDAKGEILELKDTINTMVDQLNSFAGEVTRVAKEVGSEGILGGQAIVKGVGGTWKDLTDSVNGMASNLTSQVRNIANVTTAVANGDLALKITVDAKGEILELKNTINTMVDQLNAFAGEVTRVAREVGSDGVLGGQAKVEGVGGTWKDLTQNVNGMASNLTDQVRNIANVTTAVANGDLTKKITVAAKGEILELKNTINAMVDRLNAFAGEVTRVATEVGFEGILGGQANVRDVAGTWKDLTNSVNGMASNLTSQVRNIANVTTAVANGDLSSKITVDAKGEILELKNTINAMVDRLNAFAGEVTRVAKEVGSDGILGGQAEVKGVAGTWKDLTQNVNSMATNLTNQVRGIARVVTAVAVGDLKQRLTLDAKGELAALADTINGMNDTMAVFTQQVTTVAREVGVEGKLGGQANVPGAAGSWKDLTDNVNQLAANLTSQMRAIAEVATAVTQGDLTRSVVVEAQGEINELKGKFNEMVGNLRDTTTKNSEQDWLKTNIAKFTRMLQGQRDMLTVSKSLLSELSPLVGAAHSVFYMMENDSTGAPNHLKMLSSYGFKARKNMASEWKLGEGLVGQAAFEKQRILLTNVPPDYIQISSGLGESKPLNIIVLPVLFEGTVKSVVELASFEKFSTVHQNFLEQLTDSLGIVINSIEAGTRTEDLLKQSQSLSEELQSQQEELQQSNEELEEKAELLATQNTEVERKNQEIEVARVELEEKAEQLALTSKYKSEFLANMSHELRTPLNSLLILSQQLAENPEATLTKKQVEYASTIHASGSDLLTLINDILDLSKVESGTVTVDMEEVSFNEIRDNIERTFRPLAKQKKLGFEIDINASLPPSISTDSKRLQQVIKNLLSNSMKFTEKGEVGLSIFPAKEGWSKGQYILNRASEVIAFAVKDTGIGIELDKQKIIFEAFQQADGTTSRKYGGTGLGLSISRELAYLLGGELIVKSAPGKGSTFTLYLPQVYSTPFKPFVTGETPPAGSSPSSGSPSTHNTIKPAKKPNLPKAEAPSSTTAKIAPLTIAGKEVDDRLTLKPGDHSLLIIEDDEKFSNILVDFAHKDGFKVITSARGDEGISLARAYIPTAITLDIRLPDMDGWHVLDLIKISPETRHIPVQVISAVEEEEDFKHGLEHGAFACIRKPVSQTDMNKIFTSIKSFSGKRKGKLLLVEDDKVERNAVIGMIGANDIEITGVGSGKDAIAKLKAEHFDCVVIDLKLPDVSGFQVMEQMKCDPLLKNVPIIVYTGRDLTKSEELQLQKLAESVIIKGVKSADRLLAETALFLHRVVSDMPEEKRRKINALYQSDTALDGKKALVVDDDVRNIFALTSVLERHKMVVIPAENGKLALEKLEKTPGIEVILMDIMMPEMDGYETMRAIRKQPSYNTIPIIALTAKAMIGDREKCLEAGASDYITKPVNTDQLLSLMRVWLYK